MPLDDTIRDRVILLGGTVGGVDCPNCAFASCDVDPDPVAFASVSCSEYGTTILTEEQQS